jgi:hypothetical protein
VFRLHLEELRRKDEEIGDLNEVIAALSLDSAGGWPPRPLGGGGTGAASDEEAA